jgi:hypothetical protein
MATLGAELRMVSPGAVEIALAYRADLCQQHGFVHAGVLTTIVDTACGYAREGRLDRNGDGWDDRDLDRDGRIESGRDEEDGAYLRVGERISGNFDDMPVQYRDRYRDGNGSYYRYDRGNVYQVDARTNLILRIFADAR